MKGSMHFILQYSDILTAVFSNKGERGGLPNLATYTIARYWFNGNITRLYKRIPQRIHFPNHLGQATLLETTGPCQEEESYIEFTGR